LIVVLDYGMGNLRSVEKAVQEVGGQCRVQADLAGATKLIVPGVGAFGAAMERLGPMRDEIRRYAAAGNPLLGICLGQQLLFEQSEERGEHEGLGLLAGRVRYFPKAPHLKIPHMGWSPLQIRRSDGVVARLCDGEQVYFVHSLVVEPEDGEVVAATSTHGIEFPAAVQKGNVWGAQFHPEKSGDVGLRVLENFVRW
jgi:imidazole glycerol-phosphate synthase subunit HisH